MEISVATSCERFENKKRISGSKAAISLNEPGTDRSIMQFNDIRVTTQCEKENEDTVTLDLT